MTQNCNCHGSGGQYSQTVAASSNARATRPA